MKTSARPPRTQGRSIGADEGWVVITTLLSGFVVYGAIGFGLDKWWGTHFMTPVGLIVGMALGIYAVMARVTHAAPAVTRPTTDPQSGPTPASPRRETE